MSSPVLDVYSTRYRLCRTADLSAQARPPGAPPDGHEAHHVLPSGDARVRPSTASHELSST
jgi:hypothetical protein